MKHIRHLCALKKRKIPCWRTPLFSLLVPWTFKLPDPLLLDRFTRDARPGTDNPPEVILRPILPPEIFPIELVIRDPAFPKIGFTPNPGTGILLLIPLELGFIPGIEPPTPFMLLLNPGLAANPTPRFVTPECPYVPLWDIWKKGAFF